MVVDLVQVKQSLEERGLHSVIESCIDHGRQLTVVILGPCEMSCATYGNNRG